MESIVIHQPDRLAIEQREIPVPAKGGRGAHCADGILQRTLSDYAAGHSRKRTVPFFITTECAQIPDGYCVDGAGINRSREIDYPSI